MNQTLPHKKIKLAGFGNYPQVGTKVFRPEKQRDYNELCQQNLDHVIARGLGSSYGDAALAPYVVNNERLNKILAFDNTAGIITAQAGVTIGDIMQVIVPHGFILPVIPGTKYVTIGGAIACNIHGKNHYQMGNFTACIANIKLRLINGEIVNCSPTEKTDIFRATCGGLGMSGFIEEATLKLNKIPSPLLKTRTVKVDLQELFEKFYLYRDSSDYMVGWIDHYSEKAIFQAAQHSDEEIEEIKSFSLGLNIPYYMPNWFLNDYNMALYNKLRFSCTKQKKEQFKSCNEFFYPLDNIGNWNRLYGKRGLLQYQFTISDNEQPAEKIKAILDFIKQQGIFSYLVVVKYHKTSNDLLSFALDGFSVALDFPATSEVLELLEKLDKIVIYNGGKVYLAKDARMKREIFEFMYQDDLLEWKKTLKELDPTKKINSFMGKRLGFKDYD